MRRVGLALLALIMAMPAAAQSAAPDPAATDGKVAGMIETAHAVYGVPDTRAKCRPKPGDEIVVCADRGEDQRVERGDPDPSSLEGRRALDGNIPSAPVLESGHAYCAKCPHFGSVPPPIYYVDVTKLPQAPAGSDAEAIANGEKSAP
jgi:Rieske Fe-S protein